jgi:cytochrome c-type biogenesis protein
VLFLEGVVTFISPCLLPMLPVYVSYFAGSGSGGRETFKNAGAFVLGFTAVFASMGAFAGSVGSLLREHRTALDVISGAVVILLGLNFMGVLKFNIASPFGGWGDKMSGKSGVAASALLGVMFAAVWTPCVGAFLGSALMMASNEGSAPKGFAMLVVYSAGLGIPFMASAVLIDMLKSTFGFIKKNYRVVNAIAGSVLVALGALMMTGYYGRFIS